MSGLTSVARGIAQAGLIAFAIWGCGPRGGDEGSGRQTRAVFRSAAAPIWSAAAFMPARIEGEWTQAASFVAGAALACPPGRVSLRQGAAGLMIDGTLCLDGGMRRVSGPVQSRGPGRLAVPGMSDWWVIWVDSGYRTLAIATPDGSFGFVLDRGRIGQDRLRAAGEIFDFNGYPAGRMKAW